MVFGKEIITKEFFLASKKGGKPTIKSISPKGCFQPGLGGLGEIPIRKHPVSSGKVHGDKKGGSLGKGGVAEPIGKTHKVKVPKGLTKKQAKKLAKKQAKAAHKAPKTLAKMHIV